MKLDFHDLVVFHFRALHKKIRKKRKYKKIEKYWRKIKKIVRRIY
jgi:hypothetical protein